MKLTALTVRNFRSYVNFQGEPTHRLPLGNGLNVLIGPNNCGKSNLLRAVALALQDSGGSDFDRKSDVPRQMEWAYPAITLELLCDKSVSVEKTLLNLVSDYERSAGATKPYADERKIVLRVTYRNSLRDVDFAVKGKGQKKGEAEKLDKALVQFKKCIRFIYLRSGDSLRNFLSGTFRELLHTVRQEHLTDEVLGAQKQRDDFVTQLRNDLLTPLGDHIKESVCQAVPEVESVSIIPFVPPLEDILAGAKIMIKDTADTPLLNKGTGVRGALLVGLLTYLAKHSRRSLVLVLKQANAAA